MREVRHYYYLKRGDHYDYDPAWDAYAAKLDEQARARAHGQTYAERAEAVGINPYHSCYTDPHFNGGRDCHWCHKHLTGNRRLLCDVQQVESYHREQAGQPHEPCALCREPVNETRGLLCPKCYSRTNKPAKGHYHRSGVFYVDDGHGCVVGEHPSERAFYERAGV